MLYHPTILPEIEAFLKETGMGPAYFGKKAVGNSEIVSRLRKGRPIWPHTEQRLRVFMAIERKERQRREAA